MTPAKAIEAYCSAFAARDVERVLALFDEQALYEMPLLRTRMVGHGEIRAGLARAFEIVSSCKFEMARVLTKDSTAIAEGVMDLATSRAPARVPFAAVAVMGDNRLIRLSLHLDAKPFRLWSDGPVLAVAP
jgi:ketosteroid isomerase-like protein